MALLAPSQPAENDSNEFSDEFGEDFSIDELAVIDHLLVQATNEVAAPPLAIADLGDYEGAHPYSAIWPRFRKTSQGEKRNNGDRGRDGVAEAASVPRVKVQYEYEDNELSVKDWIGVSAVSAPTAEARQQQEQPQSFVATALDPPLTSDDTFRKPDHPALGQSLQSALSPSLPPSIYPTGTTAQTAQSPLQRFRSPPKKPLSVTDLISPAWCELQYFFTLSRFGRKRPTPAMKRGSEIHLKLEEEVHKRVEVKVVSKEDGWGLRLWNVIQGLRGLREGGIAREMEVWGVLNGEVVGGVIDEMGWGKVKEEEVDVSKTKLEGNANQKPITDFFPSSTSASKDDQTPKRLVYLTDVKTRGSKSVPKGASLRPTIYQLMLYRRLLSNLADGKTDLNTIFQRYRLDPNAKFSDEFLERMGALDKASEDEASLDDAINKAEQQNFAEDPQSETFYDAPPTPHPKQEEEAEDPEPLLSSQQTADSFPSMPGSFNASDFLSDVDLEPDSLPSQNPHEPSSQQTTTSDASTQTPSTPLLSTLISTNPTLAYLASILLSELALTLPSGSKSLAPTLRAEYRDKNTGDVVGEHRFEMDDILLDTYLEDAMAWWKGGREARGVVREEGWKCGGCEFRGGCGWRRALAGEGEGEKEEGNEGLGIVGERERDMGREVQVERGMEIKGGYSRGRSVV